jgi:hypothetical protein
MNQRGADEISVPYDPVNDVQFWVHLKQGNGFLKGNRFLIYDLSTPLVE